MSRRHLPLALLLLGAAWLGGCAVGRFIVGAPSGGERSSSAGSLQHRCSSCHGTPDPAGMSAAEWSAALRRTQVRVHLPQAEWDCLAALGQDSKP